MIDVPIDSTQRAYARFAGWMYLLNYATVMFGIVAPPLIRGSGGFAEVARNVAAAEPLYRIALTSMAVSWVVLVAQNYALFVALGPVDRRLAQLALAFTLMQSAIGAVTAALSFAGVHLYVVGPGVAQRPGDGIETTLAVVRGASGSGFLILLMFFGCGSTLYFYLFHRSRYIPRALAILGMAGSALAFVVSCAALIFPGRTALFQLGWGPIGLAEVTTALWLVIVGIRVPAPRGLAAAS